MLLNKEVLISEAEKVMEFIVSKLKNLKTLNFEQLNFQKTLVVIVDINNGFAKGGALYSNKVESLIKPIKEFSSYMLDKKAQVIAFSDCHTKESPEFSFYPEHCIKGTTESQLVDELKDLNIRVIEKNSTNGFLEKNFKIDSHIENIIIIGDCTDICIYQLATSIKADFNRKNENKRVIVPIEYVDTFNAPFHNGDFMNAVFLGSMMDNGIEVVNINMK